MNDYVTRLLAEAAQPKTPSVLEQKQQSVAATAAQKQATMGGVPMTPAQLYASVAAQRNGDGGAASANPMETDMRNLSAFELNTKYGDAAQQMINNRNAASNRTTVDAAVTRNWDQTAADTVSGIGMGVASGLGGMGALGLGIVNKDAGLAAAEGLNKLTEFGQSTQSEALQAKRRLLAAQNQQDERDSTAKYENDIASGNGKFMSSLSRIGRDVLSSVGNAAVDPITLGDGVSQGVGSMIAISPVSRLLKGAGGAIEKMGTPLAIGGLEAGGSYQQSGTEVMKMSHEQLLKTSPDYAQMVLRGMDPEEARSTVANRTALTAAAITLPAAIAAGKLVAGFESNPLKMVSGKAAVGNLAKETVEEGIQGGTGQLAQNYATQINADNTKSLSEGVGEQIGTGALYGLGTAGAIQSPSLALGAASKTVNAALSKVGNFLQDRGDKVTAENEAASPASINRAVEKTKGLMEIAPDLQAEVMQALAKATGDAPNVVMTKTVAMDAYTGFMDSLQIPDSELQSFVMKPALAAVAGKTSRPEAIAALITDMAAEKDANVNFKKGIALMSMVSALGSSVASLGEIDMATLPQGVRSVLESMNGIQESIGNSPEVTRAVTQAAQFLNSPEGQSLMNDMKQTPESAQTVVAAAQMDPTAINPAVAGVVLKMAKDGSIKLSPVQTAALQTAKDLMQTAQEYDAELTAMGYGGKGRPKDIVTVQVKTDDSTGRDKDGQRSALQHAQHITKLVNSGDIQGAADALKMLGMFAQSQANKVQGFNDHFAAGRGAPTKPVQVLSAAAGFKFVDSKKPYGVTPTSVASLRFAKTVAAEARFLAGIHNGLAAAYPQLGVAPQAVPALDAILQGRTDDVAAEFANGTRAYPQEQQLPTTSAGTAQATSKVVPTKAVEQSASVAETPEPKTKLQALAVEGKAKLKDGIYYVNDPESTPYIAGNTKTGEIYINLGKLRASPDAMEKYMKNSPQKTAMFKLMGIDPTALANSFGSTKEIATFLRDHELSHQKNEDRKSYPRKADGSLDLMNEKALAIEARATLDALSDAQLKTLGTTRDAVQDLIAGKPVVTPVVAPVAPTPVVETPPAAVAAVTPTPIPVVATATPEVSPAPITAESKDAAVPVPKTVEEAYPNLVAPANAATSLSKAFTLRKIASRFLGSRSPVDVLEAAFQTTKDLKAFLQGAKLKRKVDNDIAGFYAYRVPELTRSLVARMNAALTQALNDPAKGGSLGTLLGNGTAVNDFLRGKVLNIAEPDGKGGFTYNQELVEAAVLGSLNWFLSANNSGVIREEKDVAALMGINEEDVSVLLMSTFNSGNVLTMWDTIPRMAQNITEFWGMKANDDFSQSATVGIPQAVATEVLRAMIAEGLITDEIESNNQEGNELKDLHLFKLNHDSLGVAYEAYPTLLAELVNSELPEVMYFGDDTVPLAKTQMNNPDVELTAEQQQAVINEQKTPFFLNKPMLDLYQQLSLKEIMSIFGVPELTAEDKKLYNKTHLETVEGKNLSISSAFDSLMGRVKEMESVAAVDGSSLYNVAARFAYGVSRVGRMQMLGKQNPQASKLVREALMPNQSTIDLTNQEDYNGYMLSVAQMLGVKVHTKPLQDSIAEALALLNGKLKPAVDLMKDFQETGKLDPRATEILKSVMPDAGSTFMGLHAIVDYARTLDGKTDLGNYTTNVYVEADGVTNGPVNAMVNLAIGKFTESWVKNIAKGGLSLTPNKTMNQHRQDDGVDLYMESTHNFANQRNSLNKALTKDGHQDQMMHLMRLMNTFIKDVSFNEATGEVTLQRGVAKNPLTITIYGSGARGIANKVTGELLDSIYAKMSSALQKQAANPGMSIAEAMFGDMASANRTADQLYQDFQRSMAVMSTNKLVYSDKKGKFYKFPHTTTKINKQGQPYEATTFPITIKELDAFKVRGAQLDALQGNMLTMFVTPLRNGIEQTVGMEVMETAKMLQVATQLQSIGLQVAFQKAVQAAVKKFQRADTLFLSRNEQKAVMAELIKQFPTVKTKGQEFLIAGTSRSLVKASDFSRALKEGYEMKATVFGPTDSGVAGSPFLNIGMGDGLMMQLMSTMKGAIEGTLKIFDGVNMPVDKIKEGSLQANEAVAGTWQGNPMRAVSNSFNAAQENILSAIEDLDEKSSEYLALIRLQEALQMDGLSLKDLIETVAYRVQNMADEVEARHTAMKSVHHSIDQMASAEMPYQNQGEDLSSLAPDLQVARLNEIYEVELAKIKARMGANAANSAELKGRGNPIVLEPRIMYTFEGMLTEVKKMPADLQETAKQALRSPAMRDYRIVVASADQINEETGGMLGNDNGMTVPATKTIYLAVSNPEVWVHELVHAATYEKVEAALNGTSKDTQTNEAVVRLQALRDQFNAMAFADQSSWTTEQVKAFREAQNSMENANNSFGEAAELNELMAWATTNEALIELGKNTKAVPSALVNFTRAVVNTIRRIFFGSAPDKLPKDFFNAVRFNTGLISSSRADTATGAVRNLILRHSNAYGNDARLNQIHTAYLDLMEPLFQGLKNLPVKNATGIHSTLILNTVGAYLPMSQQEQSVFQTIVAALATEAYVNPTSVAKAQELYNYVSKQLTVEDFKVDRSGNDPVDYSNARELYDIMLGKTALPVDAYGRSALMPVFLAMATTNDRFRAVLAKMELPKNAKNTGTTLDDYLRNYGTNAMEALSNRLSGVKASYSVMQAIDGLHNTVMATAEQKSSLLGKASDTFGKLVDTANTKVVDKLGAAAKAGMAYGDKMKQSNNKYVAGAAGIVKVTSGMLSDETSGFAAEGTLSSMNKREGLQPLRDFANDLIGRVGSNADIYDMIKKVRSTVAAVRQEFRENVPTKLEKMFKVKPTDDQWTALNRAMGKTDMAALDMTFTDITELVRNKAKAAQAVKAKEDAIKAVAGTTGVVYLSKAKQLADYMKTGKPGNNLLRNADAIARLLGEKAKKVTVTPELTKNIDELVSLYALRDMEQNERDAFNSLVQDEGLAFTFAYLKQQRTDETVKAKLHAGSKFNYYKGYIPSVQSSGMSLIVADDTQDAMLVGMSYVRVGTYSGAGVEGSSLKKGYYFSNTPTRAPFSQGIMQNVNMTAGGVSTTHGYTQGLTAGVINDPAYVTKLTQRITANAQRGTNEHLMPVFNQDGDVIAYERSVDPVQLERLQSNNKLHQMLGVWRGRQVEESMADAVNSKLVDNMAAMYEKDRRAGRASEYVNIFDPKDKILTDALKLMPATVRDYMANVVGNDQEFFVRRDMMFDAFGYRAASVGDAWTGNSRFSPETQKVFQRVALGIMGNKAFGKLVNAEKFVQGFMGDARTTIVVKSIVVPALNIVSNLAQLVSRGVPLKDVLRKSPTKMAEIESYVKNRLRQVDAGAELVAATTTNEKLKLEAEIQSLKDAQRRLTIWPLIEAGEFTAISDVGVMHDDVDLSQGRWQEYIEKQVDKLPEAVRNAGRYAYITKDTALFQGLQKAVQYGDFLTKAILYDDMVLRQGKMPEEAMGKITEEFVNYDRLPGRFRGYMEQMGLLWFYNFKLRSTKIAISMLRNNPVHALMASLMPVPDVFGPVGSPAEDNFLAKAVSGTLGYSVGPDMGLRAPTLNPWWNMVN